MIWETFIMCVILVAIFTAIVYVRDKIRTGKPIILGSTWSEQLNPAAPLYQLSAQIPWKEFEREFSEMYSRLPPERKAKRTRLMIALIILQGIFGVDEEEVIDEWEYDEYYQYFSGEEEIQYQRPCTASELKQFRDRIGKNGVRKILKVGVKLYNTEVDTARNNHQQGDSNK